MKNPKLSSVPVLQTEAEHLDEESIVKILWTKLGEAERPQDPFDDDAAWVKNQARKRFVVGKADMFVASTDAPPQMTPAQMAHKAIVACISDLAAKGVSPKYCLVSVGIPSQKANREFVTALGAGFSATESEYGVKIIGGDTNAINSDTVIDCSIFGFANSLVSRKGSKPGDIVGVSGNFGAQPAGLLILLQKATSKDGAFRELAIKSVLEPKAQLKTGLKISKNLSSCIDSSDGLAISLYHLAESSNVSIQLGILPEIDGLEDFALENQLKSEDLVLFGGEEYELVCTYPKKSEKVLTKLGIKKIGTVVERTENRSEVLFRNQVVPRRGWVHFKS